MTQDAKRDGKLPEGVMPRILQRLAEPSLGDVNRVTTALALKKLVVL